jgi:hypothetical protein
MLNGRLRATAERRLWADCSHLDHGLTSVHAFRPETHPASPVSDEKLLKVFVEQCLADGVSLLAIAGPGSEALEEIIDWLAIADGSDPSRFLCTTSHPNESLDESYLWQARGTPKKAAMSTKFICSPKWAESGHWWHLPPKTQKSPALPGFFVFP